MNQPRFRVRTLEGIARCACRRYKLVLLLALLLTGASLIPPLTIGMYSAFNIAKMLPQEIPAARVFTRAIVDFDSADEAVVVFRLMEGLDQVPEVGPVAEAIAEELRKDERIKAAFCRKFNDSEKKYLLEEELPRRGLLLLKDEQLDRVKALLHPKRMSYSIRKTKRRLIDSGGENEDLQTLIAHDALGLFSLFEGSFKNLSGGSSDGEDAKKKLKGNYIVAEITPEKQKHVKDDAKAMLLLIIQPRQAAQSISFSEDIMKTIRATTLRILKEKLPPKMQQQIRIEFGGGYEISTRYQGRMYETLMWTLITSLLGVIALFGYCFRRYGVLLYIGVPLVMVVSWTIGIGWIVFGQLNIISCAFAAVLVGLGVDYAIHIYNRYIEERAAGATLEDAFVTSLTQTGWAVFIGMVTTCMAFLALYATRFSQLSQFGVLAGLGIVLSVPGMLFVLPALIAWRNAHSPEHLRTLTPTHFGLETVAYIVTRHRKWVIVAAALLAALSIFNLTSEEKTVRFNEQISSLRPQDRAFELGGEIARVFSNRNPNKLMLLAYGDTEREALEKASDLAGICKELREEGLLVDYESVMRYLPSPQKQEERLKKIRAIDFEKALTDFRTRLDEEGMAEEPFHLTFKLLEEHARLARKGEIILPSMFYSTPVGKWARRLVTQRRRMLDLRHPIPAEITFPVTLAKPAVDRRKEVKKPTGTLLTREELIALGPQGKHDGKGWVKRIVILDKGWTVKANVYPPIKRNSKTADLQMDEAWIKTVTGRLGINMKSADVAQTGAFLTGTSLLAHELAGVVKQDFWNVSIAVFVVAVLVLAIFFHRHPIRVVYCLLPIVLGLIYLFGIMTFFQIEFNFINVLAIPILIGLGVDNGIHLVERFYEGHRRVEPMVTDTGRAIMVTSLTSMIGFGSLAVGGYQGITSMGKLSILALASSLFASLIVFPAILSTFSPPEEMPAKPEEDLD